MNTFCKNLLVLLCSLLLGTAAIGAERGTKDEAVTLVKAAAAFLKANGRDAAWREFNKPKGKFVNKDLYIFVIDVNGKNMAHGANTKLIGKNLLGIKDVDGKPVIQEMLDIAKEKGKGWIDYKWPDPVAEAINLKSTYFEKVDDVVIACGIQK